LPGFHAGRHDLSQALVAFRRAIRAHRRLAKLHPEQFDATESERFRRRRESDREWLAMWEPALHEIYGSSPDDKPPNPLDDLPPEPKSSRTRQAIDREFAKLRFWMEVGSKAFKRYNQRGSRALISLGQVVRILEIGFDLARLVVPDDISDEEFSHAQALADLERAYGRPLPGEDEETFSGAAPAPVAPATPPHEPLP
jgi:hypothetical protein